MNRKLLALALSLIVIAITAAVLVPGTVRAANDVSSYPLNILWRVQVPRSGAIDYMTTTSSSERNLFPSDGAIAYIFRNNIPGTAVLYREYNAAIPDHMDSEILNESGYVTEAPLGYAWTSSTSSPGLTRLLRGWNPATYDQITLKTGDSYPTAYCCAANFAKWGYARYGNSEENILELSAGGVTVESNLNAGGAIWRWWWNGTEFLNNYDYGRQIQTSTVFKTSSGQDRNPTEAGDTYSSRSTVAANRHGSPVTVAYNQGTTQVTQVLPLDFNPDVFGGGVDNPVLYTDMRIEKRITLNYNNMGPVAQYVTRVYTPIQLDNATLEVPTGYLRGAFNRFWNYNASTDTLTERLPVGCGDPSKMGFNPDFGGVIISNQSTGRAMGVYGVNRRVQGGSVNNLIMFNFNCYTNDPNTETSLNTTKWLALYGPGTIAGGWTEYHTWIVSADLATVTQQMRQLYIAGVR